MKDKIITALIIIVMIAFLVVVGGIFLLSGTAENVDKLYYDNNNNLVRQAGSNPASLADFQRKVVVKGLDVNDNGAELFANITLGWIVKERNKEYVVVPLAAFFVPTSFGPAPAWEYPEIVGLKAYLLPSPEEDDWKEEELGDISINEDIHVAVIERTDPIIGIRADYKVGRYQNLAIDDAVYLLSQTNGRMNITRTNVSEVYVDEQGRNLFNAPAGQEGGLAFAIRKGKFELVGFLSVMEPSEQEFGQVYLYYQDIQQVLDFIKTQLTK